MNPQLSTRVRISLFNLCLVALLGVLMRFKIGFAFPYFDQANLQHAHSHFAFYGWVTHLLMTLMIMYLEKKGITDRRNFYNRLILANLLSAYGMLISFSISGYNAASIILSTMSLIISYLFTISFLKDIRAQSGMFSSAMWFKAALFFNVLSSAGTLALAYMMATRNIPQHLYLGSVYFYLHFQYNGWFFFAAMGLLQLYFHDVIPGYRDNKTIFRMFAFSCLPAYFLSVLWMPMPAWLYSLVVMASVVQFVAWIWMLRIVSKVYAHFKHHVSSLVYYLFILLSIALTVKFTLQLGSVIPFVSKLAFGFRPIVIAYLHLVLLAVISLFLLTYLMANHLIRNSRLSKTGLIMLATGIYATELTLAVQGIASFTYTMIPYTNETLFFLSLVMFSGIILLLAAQASPTQT